MLAPSAEQLAPSLFFPSSTSAVVLSSSPKKTQKKNNAPMFSAPVADFLAGSVAGVTGKTAEHPFDLIKVRLQSQAVDQVKVLRGPLHCLQNTLRYEGVRGLYKGLSTPLLGSMAENAFLFVCYNKIQAGLRHIEGLAPNEDLSIRSLVVAGTLSGACVSVLLTPIELIKCRLQVQDGLSEARYRGPLDVLRQTLSRDGVFGLFRGHLGTFLRESAGGAAWFGSYEYVTRKLTPPGKTKDDLPATALIAAGAAAGVAYNVALYPADVVKSQMQTSESSLRLRFGEVLRRLYAVEGVRGLYRGFGITLVRAMPCNAIIFCSYEWSLRALGGGSKRPADALADDC